MIKREYVCAALVLAVSLSVTTLTYNFLCWHFFRGYNEVTNMIVLPAVGTLVAVNLALAGSVWALQRSGRRSGLNAIATSFFLSAVITFCSPLFAPSIGRFANRNLWIRTPLIEAARYGDSQVVIKLLEHGDNPNVRDPGLRTTPLHYMAARGETQAVEQLLKSGADPNAKAYGETPLDWARNGRAASPTLKLLIDAGAKQGTLPKERQNE